MIKELFPSTLIPGLLVVVFILIKLGEMTFNISLVHFGVYPRTIHGLIGIITYPFIHANWPHLFNNSTAIFILGSMLFYFYRPVALKSLLWIYLMSGLWLWIGGRESYHIGASGVIYGLFGFLFVSGLLRKHLKLMALSLLVVFLYGSLVWGILPIDHSMSFEGHLFGLIAGVLIALVYRKQGPQKPKYSWELVDEEEIPDWYPDPERIRREQAEKQLEEQKKAKEGPRQIQIKYVYRKNDNQEDRN